MGRLNDLAIRKALPREKPYKLSDGGGLFLLVTPAGGKLWRLKYRVDGKEKLLSLGKYPDISLVRAGELVATARRKIADGLDPAAEKADARAKRAEIERPPEVVTFAKVAEVWAAEMTAQKHLRTIGQLESYRDYATAGLGHLAVGEVKASDIMRTVKDINKAGKRETARRVFSTISRIFRYAVAHDLVERNPASDVKLADFLPSSAARHFACLKDPKAIGGLMRAIDEYEGSPITRLALKLAALTFVRPGELRHAEWMEVDTEAAEWRIPPEKMKMKALHIVPLSKQALVVIEALQPLTGGGLYLFPSERSGARAMSNNTVNAALRRMGYTREEMTGHGFRGMASTRLHELGYSHQVIEAQLAHAERDEVAAAYNHALYLEDRRKLMQAWADQLDELRKGAQVIPFVA
ncbi:putative integrase [Sterolibacterium denitrificans]|uniref:Integrase n=1 Tax=Sterolibacterium denitrificans TaxID=157592 RepID=A0A7Z7MVR1_9PROT|nr:integrase arm-type DNA-binding domain-containing protein [Sterolibacterium denitrificans]SMB28633.1 putative integrase [Sterolibacterium denitrificans]